MELDNLLEFGMTHTEAKIYFELTHKKETKIGSIIKNTGLHRGTVYNSISNLIKKGFVSFVNKNGTKFYKISGKGIFDNLLKERIKTIKKEKLEIDKIFKEIENFHARDEDQDVQVIYGTEAFKTLFLDIYKTCKEKNIEYLFLGRGGEMQDETGKLFYENTQRIKKRNGIKCRIILDKETISHDYQKYIKGNRKYLPKKVPSPANFWIYEDIVLIVLFGTKPLVNIKINSKLLSDAFRNYFENLWKIARPL
jgi:sugar-specific transcriptional regulator TrmB